MNWDDLIRKTILKVEIEKDIVRLSGTYEELLLNLIDGHFVVYN